VLLAGALASASAATHVARAMRAAGRSEPPAAPAALAAQPLP
jgi:hypothetical protein